MKGTIEIACSVVILGGVYANYQNLQKNDRLVVEGEIIYDGCDDSGFPNPPVRVYHLKTSPNYAHIGVFGTCSIDPYNLGDRVRMDLGNKVNGICTYIYDAEANKPITGPIQGKWVVNHHFLKDF